MVKIIKAILIGLFVTVVGGIILMYIGNNFIKPSAGDIKSKANIPAPKSDSMHLSNSNGLKKISLPPYHKIKPTNREIFHPPSITTSENHDTGQINNGHSVDSIFGIRRKNSTVKAIFGVNSTRRKPVTKKEIFGQ